MWTDFTAEWPVDQSGWGEVLQMFTYHETSSKRDSIWTRGLSFSIFRVNTTLKEPALTVSPCLVMLWTCIIVAVAMLSFVRTRTCRRKDGLYYTGTSICNTIEVSFKPDFSQFDELLYSLHVRKSGYNTSLDTYVNHIIHCTISTPFDAPEKKELLMCIGLSLNSCFAWGLALRNLYISMILSSHFH
ncbi:hypothetical protein C8J56DRAFT_941087 [Mycena floridula]|nr:hypothetical protein C8J56DRAFT_941087 [Mycena floridula]